MQRVALAVALKTVMTCRDMLLAQSKHQPSALKCICNGAQRQIGLHDRPFIHQQGCQNTGNSAITETWTRRVILILVRGCNCTLVLTNIQTNPLPYNFPAKIGILRMSELKLD